MSDSLKFVRTVYGFWGKIPIVYNLSNLITYLGKEKFLRERAVSLLRITEGDKILEVACGNGSNFPQILTRIGNNGNIVGFDYSADMLQAARDRIEKNDWKRISLKQGDAAKMPFEDNSFDGIISTLGISAIPDFKSALNNCLKILKKGKYLVILDAKPFEGKWQIFNPFIKVLYSIGAS